MRVGGQVGSDGKRALLPFRKDAPPAPNTLGGPIDRVNASEGANDVMVVGYPKRLLFDGSGVRTE